MTASEQAKTKTEADLPLGHPFKRARGIPDGTCFGLSGDSCLEWIRHGDIGCKRRCGQPEAAHRPAGSKEGHPMTAGEPGRADSMADALEAVIDADRRERDECSRWRGGGPGSYYREAISKATKALAAFRAVPGLRGRSNAEGADPLDSGVEVFLVVGAPAPPLVTISEADIRRVYEAGSCGNPNCVACAVPDRSKP